MNPAMNAPGENGYGFAAERATGRSHPTWLIVQTDIVFKFIK